MPWGEFLSLYGLVLPAIVFGAFVARATGVGFALVVVATLLALPHVDQPTALFIAAPLSLFNLSFIAVTLFRKTPWGTLGSLSIPLAAGFLAGFVMGLVLPKAWILVLGLGVVAYNLLTMLRPPTTHQTGLMSRAPVGGGLTGFMTGALSFPGPPISAFFLARGFIGDRVRVSVAFVGLAGSGLRLVFGGTFTVSIPEFWQLMLVGIPLIVLGTSLGWLAAKRMSARVHRALISLMTVLAFVSLAYGLYGEIYVV